MINAMSLKEIFVFIEEILLGMIGIILILRFYNRVYKKPIINKMRLYLYAVIIIPVVSTSVGVLLPGRAIAVPPITVLCSFLFLRYYLPDRKKKILFSCILFMISCVWLMLADLIITPLQSQYYWGIIVFAHLVFWLILELINKIGKYEETDIPFSMWLLLMIITVSSAAALYIILYFIISRENPYVLTSEIPIMLVLLFINLSLFIFFDRFSILMHDTKEKAVLEQRLQMQEKHYQELETTHNQIRSIQHDMKNHLRTAIQLVSGQESNGELIAFLKKKASQISEVEQVIATGNVYLDTILNIKVSEMMQAHIEVDTDIHIPSNIKLSFEQITTILGNLLDNVKEACQLLPENERWAKIQINYINHTLFIRIENSFSKAALWEKGLPLSIKKNSAQHGIGLKNVRKIVEETGAFCIEETPVSFLVRIALYGL